MIKFRDSHALDVLNTAISLVIERMNLLGLLCISLHRSQKTEPRTRGEAAQVTIAKIYSLTTNKESKFGNQAFGRIEQETGLGSQSIQP